MDTEVRPQASIARAFLAVALHVMSTVAFLTAAPTSHAGPVYRCTGAHGEIAYRDTPCPPGTGQREVAVAPQPLIGNPADRVTSPRTAPRRRTAIPRAARPTRTKAAKVPTSFECRAANGEVFYRHARCPGSVAGDGVVRIDYSERTATEHPRRRATAWDRVPVRGTAIPRAEACRRIRAAGAAGRDGHARDEKVSAYERAMGRDPCSDA